MVVLGLVLFALALWLVGVRDWRVYGVVGLWPQVAGEMRVSHLTPLLCVLAALAWRTRHDRLAPGLAVGVAVAMKFFAWPLGLWLAARRSLRGGAARRRRSARASLLLVLPFTPLDDYVRVLLRLGRGFDQDAYTIFGLVVQAGGPELAGRIATFAVGCGAARRDVALPQLHPRPRRRARPLADRLARLLRGRPRAARHRPAAALGRSGSSPSRRGGCRAPASGPATPRPRCGC